MTQQKKATRCPAGIITVGGRLKLQISYHLLSGTKRSITDVCLDVGFNSLGTFSRTFRAIVGESPSAYRARFADGGAALRVPACFAMAWTRPAG